ncbi:HNH endonuclease [Nocardia sp. NEAU-G5]|uniref:HNH endonuclease n=2 Tax=Nocardia albiluteola TaxID=2842303 RepID=A0ABS6B8L7_9NOCA|nr:HNH endonuclease [Nocardia albiluteola]
MFDSRELQAMSDEGLIDALQRAHGAAAFAQAAEVLAARELYRRREASGGEPAGEFAVAEAAVAVQITEGVAAALIDIGLGLDRLPRTREAFGSGRIDLARAQVIAESIRDLPEEMLAEVEKTLIEAAARTNPARLRQTARRWVAKLDPGGERNRRERREGDRDVRIKAVQDGMAVFDGLLPAPGAQTVAMRLREMALEVCGLDPRTMPQRRADALVALADGSRRLRCGCGRETGCPAPRAEAPRRPLIQIGVPVGTLLGELDAPAHLAGYGPIDAESVRRIAEHAQFELIPERTEDPTSTQEAMAAEPAPWQEREIRALDALCRFPGCTMPAAESLLDHTDPFDPAHPGRGGGTLMANLAVLCARHYRLKSLSDRAQRAWRVHRSDADTLRWTSPTGGEHTSGREGTRYLFPHSDIEEPDVLWPNPATTPAAPRPSTIDLTYPIDHGAFVRPGLRPAAPEDDYSGRYSVDNPSR